MMSLLRQPRSLHFIVLHLACTQAHRILTDHGQFSANTLSLLLSGPYSGTYQQKCTPQADDIAEFEQYAEFHKTCRTNPACLSNAVVWQCEDSDSCAGLGDEIRGIVATMYMAMASKRPFFVRWKRMGNDMLNFFTANKIDVRAPDSVSTCKRTSIIDNSNYEEVWKQISAAEGCRIWTTNVQLHGLVNNNVLRNHYPVMEHVKYETAVGCSMNYHGRLGAIR
eukprot:TRINITY_DN11648_c0_g1_i2.p1 TRINITY_DN11648_c0_g1~~TRINITY_DN11648_c0_g1_i2.p1  ORF type:complete len:240 (+),score=32.09 TRINITY_DN11648_c0_g1_i2:54-722(+)